MSDTTPTNGDWQSGASDKSDGRLGGSFEDDEDAAKHRKREPSCCLRHGRLLGELSQVTQGNQNNGTGQFQTRGTIRRLQLQNDGHGRHDVDGRIGPKT